jgi:hypothetical protein
MEWLVCKNKMTGELFVMPRSVRELMIGVLTDFNNGVNSIVVKGFENIDDASQYLIELNETDKLINKTLE